MRRAAPIVVAAMLALVGCGSGDSTSTGSTTVPDDAAPGFPVTVEGLYGDVTVEREPERIVVVGAGRIGEVLAVGAEPLVVNFPFATTDVKEQFAWLGDFDADEDPALFIADNQPNFEALAAYEPDLIIGYSWYADEAAYETLSAIAPTYLGREATNGDWRATTPAIGALTGNAERAAQVVAEVEAEIASVRESLPALEGKTYSAASFWGGTRELWFWSQRDSSILQELGLTPSRHQPDAAGESLSIENIDLLDGDLLWVDADDGGRTELETDRRWALLPAVGSDTVIWTDGNGGPLYEAVIQPNPLSYRYVIDNILPTLETLADS